MAQGAKQLDPVCVCVCVLSQTLRSRKNRGNEDDEQDKLRKSCSFVYTKVRPRTTSITKDVKVEHEFG